MRVTSASAAPAYSGNTLAKSSTELAKFIKVSPEQHRKIAQLICNICDRMGKVGFALIQDFVHSAAEGKLTEFSKRWSEQKVPMSILSDLLAIGQEIEADTRDKVDELILKAQKGALELGKQALTKALALL